MRVTRMICYSCTLPDQDDKEEGLEERWRRSVKSKMKIFRGQVTNSRSRLTAMPFLSIGNMLSTNEEGSIGKNENYVSMSYLKNILLPSFFPLWNHRTAKGTRLWTEQLRAIVLS